jgi:hypothetical protein
MKKKCPYFLTGLLYGNRCDFDGECRIKKRCSLVKFKLLKIDGKSVIVECKKVIKRKINSDTSGFGVEVGCKFKGKALTFLFIISK